MAEAEKHYTVVSTMPGSLDTKFVQVELEEEDACKDCKRYPTFGLWGTCFGCREPVCERCAWQLFDGHFCRDCAARITLQFSGQ